MKATFVGNLAPIRVADFEGRLWSADRVGNTFAAKTVPEINSAAIVTDKAFMTASDDESIRRQARTQL